MELEDDGTLYRAGLETFPALLAEVKHDRRFAFMKPDDIRRAGPGTSPAAVTAKGIDPGIQSLMTRTGMGVNTHFCARYKRTSTRNF